MCLCKPEIRTPWCNDCQSFAYQRIKELEKLNARLRATLNRLYKSVSDGEHLSKEWIKDALLSEPNHIAVDSLVKMRSVDAVKIKGLESTILDLQSELARKKMSLTVACNRVEELEDKLKIAVSALRRVDNIAYEIDNKEINDIACNALEQLGELN